jgi:hypothetical protein
MYRISGISASDSSHLARVDREQMSRISDIPH